MSERLTKNWTETSELAFGKSGQIGDAGENSIVTFLNQLGYEVNHQPNDWATQCEGIDLFIRRPGTITWWSLQIKTNLHTHTHKESKVCIEQEAFEKSKADFWLHTNIENKNDIIIYKRSSMIKYLKENNIPYVLYKGKHLQWIDRNTANNL